MTTPADAPHNSPASMGTFEFRHLEALLSLGRTRSFSAAAEELGYTQSAISQQIARLERVVGTPLVKRARGHRLVSLTEAGEILVHHAEAVAARLTSATADLAALSRGESGTLRVGCYQSVGVRLLPRVLRIFRETWPQVAIELTQVEDDAHLLDEVEAGHLDVSFMVLPLPEGPFSSAELLEDPYVAVAVPETWGDGDRRSVDWKDLIGKPLITYARMRPEHAVENRLGHPELGEQIAFRSHDNGTLLGLAEEGLGTAVMSWLSVPTHTSSLSILPIDDVSPRIVGIAWHRDRIRTRAAEDFIRIAKQESFAEKTRMDESLSQRSELGAPAPD